MGPLLILLLWVGGAIFVAVLAKSKGRSGVLWFIISMIIDPILALIGLMVASGR